MFWRHFPEAHNAGSVNPCDGFAEAAAAVGEFIKSAKDQTDNSVRVGSILRAKFQEFCLDRAHFVEPGVVVLLVEVSAGLEVVFVHLRRSFLDRKCLTVVEVARREVLVATATGQGLEVAQGLDNFSLRISSQELDIELEIILLRRRIYLRTANGFRACVKRARPIERCG